MDVIFPGGDERFRIFRGVLEESIHVAYIFSKIFAELLSWIKKRFFLAVKIQRYFFDAFTVSSSSSLTNETLSGSFPDFS